jgi:hypothetical protein
MHTAASSSGTGESDASEAGGDPAAAAVRAASSEAIDVAMSTSSPVDSAPTSIALEHMS